MANIILSANKNWSDCSGGGPPGATDDIYLVDYTLTLDGANNATYTCGSIYARSGVDGGFATGIIQITNYGSAPGPSLNFNLYGGRTTVFNNTISNKYISYIKSITGGSGTNAYGLNAAGGIIINSIDAIYGGFASTSYGVMISNGNISTINLASGNLTSAIYASTYGQISNILYSYGGNIADAHGIYLDARYTTVDLIGYSIGGSIAGAYGLFINRNGDTTIVSNSVGGLASGAYGTYLTNTSYGYDIVIGTSIPGSVSGAAGVGSQANDNVLALIQSSINNGITPSMNINNNIFIPIDSRVSIQNTELITKSLVVDAANVLENTPRWIGASGTDLGTLEQGQLFDDSPSQDIYPAISGNPINNGTLVVNNGHLFTESQTSSTLISLSSISGKYATRMNDINYY